MRSSNTSECALSRYRTEQEFTGNLLLLAAYGGSLVTRARCVRCPNDLQ